MKLTLLNAIAESIANRSVPVVCTSDPEGVVAWIRSNYWDVDFDPHPDRVTVFGDDPSIPVADDGDGDEGHFVIDLVFPVASQSNPFNE